MNMTYKDFLQNIIEKRGQWGIPNGEYFEGHHIVPKCLGGKGKPKRKDKNIIWLYPQEHYEAHKLLALENPNNESMQIAWYRVSHCRKNNVIIQISKEEYALMRRKISQVISKRFLGHAPWNKGKKNVYNQETLRKMGEKNIGHIPWNKGKKWEKKTIEKLKQKKKEQVLKSGEPHQGKKHSNITKEVLSKYFTNHPSHSTQIINETTGEIYISKAICQKKLNIGKKMLEKFLKEGKTKDGQKIKILKNDTTLKNIKERKTNEKHN